MRIKFAFFFVLSIIFGAIVSKQNQLIKIPKEERQLVQIPEKSISDDVKVVNDGDSFVLDNGEIVRLFGIDAPELDQPCMLFTEVVNIENEVVDKTIVPINSNVAKSPSSTPNNSANPIASSVNIVKNEKVVKCGEDSRDRLVDLISNSKVDCLIKGRDAYDRLVGDCSVEKYNNRTKKSYRININKEMVLNGNAVAFTQISDKYLEDENVAKSEGRGIWSMDFELPSEYRKSKNK